ncbi:cupin domain-containing protein [Galactobacter valiniphilus]|uniref:cupin domain-containing protein n=1 Tax=Galactobacter valiniphilus TaxID=2676122 RepID=UPI003736CBA3
MSADQMQDFGPEGVVSVPGLSLPLQELPAEEVVAGAPQAAAAELGSLGGVDYGVWEMTAGTATDVEADEVFVVLSGSATVTIAEAGGHAGRVLELGPGSLVHLWAGEESVWEVHSPLRKVYFTPAG